MNSFDYKIKKLDSLIRDDEGKPFTLPNNDEATAQADSTIDDVPQDDSKD